MYAMFTAVALPVGVVAMNLALANFEYQRIHTIAQFQADAVAFDEQKEIISKRNSATCRIPTTCTIFLAGDPGGARRHYACGSFAEVDSNPDPTYSPACIVLKAYTTSEFTVRQRISCQSVFFGS